MQECHQSRWKHSNPSRLVALWDAETQLGDLEISSNAPQFMGWESETESILVEFDRIVYDSAGSPIPQGLFITINDGEDTNTGTLLFNVIENGRPGGPPYHLNPSTRGSRPA